MSSREQKAELGELRSLVDQAAEEAKAHGSLTREQIQQTIFDEGPKPFRYSVEMKKPLDGGPLISRWEFEVPNASVVGWLRKEDLKGLIEVMEELIQEMDNPIQDLVRPPSGLIVPGQ